MLPAQMHQAFELAAWGLVALESGFLALMTEDRGRLEYTLEIRRFLEKFYKVNIALDKEIPSYRGKIVLCKNNTPLPNTFWELVDEAISKVLRADFGGAREVFGRAQGQLAVYDEQFGLCANLEAASGKYRQINYSKTLNLAG